MPKDSNKSVPIKYTSREFSEIRNDLLEIVERFYPDKFQDWSEGSFGSLMIDSVAYVADQLSFYLDYNVNESFLDTAYQYGNITRHGKALGYKPRARSSAFGKVALFVLIPASATGLGPDQLYTPVLQRGTTFTSKNNISYILTQNVDFGLTTNPRVVARVNDTTGAPTFYAVKAYGDVVSGILQQNTYNIGPFERFKTISINDPNVVEIIKVVDAQGNEYFEVDYLSQDIVYKEISNNNYLNDNVPSILKPMLVSRKFTTTRNRSSTTIQFGSGDESADNVVAEPQSMAIDLFGKNYTTDIAFDPTRLSLNSNFGIAPSNTTITVAYRTLSGRNNSAGVGAINKVVNAKYNFSDVQKLSSTKIQDVEASLEVVNETPIIGDASTVGMLELKQQIFDTFPTQNRAVTQADYENIALRMPEKFGSVKRVSVQRDPDSMKRNLNMYVIAQDPTDKLMLLNRTIKNNLKIWLNQYRMINDTIDILDPFIINLGIDFVVQATPNANKHEVLEECISALKRKFETKFYIGEHLNISEVYKELNKIDSVVDVALVQIVPKIGTNYSSNSILINKNMSPNGTKLICPKNAIFEIKFPDVDFTGNIR